MSARNTCLAGRSTAVVGSAAPRADLILLHGYDMNADAFTPFAQSMQLPVNAYLPTAHHQVSNGGFSWWPVDEAARQAQLNSGARDLALTYPVQREQARAQLCKLADEIRRLNGADQRPLILCGFSQGGMLACDALMQTRIEVDALIVLSACRIALEEWRCSQRRLAGLPVLLAHGREDQNLSLAAGQALAKWLESRGAHLELLEFDGAHETPLPVWRAVRRFVLSRFADQSNVASAIQSGGYAAAPDAAKDVL